ncbi:hypothetical protein LMH87_009628 [Akanthomyces muscarius]|uniref:AMP-dependent synthetase/ligase domain-containing protein n=1 Tax=Akanthomyces muscarius TaxID=2231603 RepID=A0A9W8QF39_AKAMU|nr:hypothetical protein LMH87_009628 [Akanthomyces muscarius]KAJ4153124.1 hypothetical protein LMH87_009628 [Akanthomyces muscarius]
MERFTQEAFEERSRRLGPLLVLDDVLSVHVGKTPSPVLFAYPRGDGGRGDDFWDKYTAAQLDGYVDAAVRHLLDSGHEPKLGRVVGILGAPNLDWVVHLFALSRLGYCVAMMSLRQKAVGLANLLVLGHGDAVAYDATPGTKELVDGVVALQPSATTTTIPFVPRAVYTAAATTATTTTTRKRFFSREEQNRTMALLFSTSGSTGLPRPIPYRHAHIALSMFTSTEPLSSILSWPLYHGWGLSVLLGTFYYGETCHVMDTITLPEVTGAAFIEALEAARPGFIPSPPHNVALIAGDPRGLACLRAAEYVTTGGARLPDELGAYLVEQGVNISTSMGSSEATRNFATSMYRPRGDPEWDYVQIAPVLRPHILLDPVPGSAPLHEIVFLPEFPGLGGSTNSDDPRPGSYRTGDIMRPHPEKLDAWKFVCRNGDFLALSTTLKVLGAPFEDRVERSPLVEAAVVVGEGRTAPGMLVLPTEEGEGMGREGLLDGIWPMVEEANKVVPGHSEMARERVCVLPRTAKLPRTDKGNVVRQKVYTEFASEIDGLYT